jgi:hypothetical protein
MKRKGVRCFAFLRRPVSCATSAALCIASFQCHCTGFWTPRPRASALALVAYSTPVRGGSLLQLTQEPECARYSILPFLSFLLLRFHFPPRPRAASDMHRALHLSSWIGIRRGLSVPSSFRTARPSFPFGGLYYFTSSCPRYFDRHLFPSLPLPLPRHAFFDTFPVAVLVPTLKTPSLSPSIRKAGADSISCFGTG